MTPSDESRLEGELLAVIRGERPWRSVQGALGVNYSDGKWTHARRGSFSISPTLKDFAIGFLRVRSNAESAYEWAGFILASPTIVLMDSVHDSPYDDVVLNALWDMAEAKEPEPEFWDLATQLAEQ